MPADAFYADECDVFAAPQAAEGDHWPMVRAYAGCPQRHRAEPKTVFVYRLMANAGDPLQGGQ